MSLSQHLLALEDAQLIRLATLTPELQYLFRHALVQEAAYGSLVRADRQRLHLAVGECLEQLAPDARVAPELAALLARHFDRAGDERAYEYALAAAQAATGRYANAEAVSFFDLALRWAPRRAEAAKLGDLYAARGRALELLGQFDPAFANYTALAAAGAERGQAGLQLRALVLQGQLRSTTNPLFDLAEGERLADEGLALARTLGDKAAEAKIYWNRLNLQRFAGDNVSARANGEASLRLARELELAEQIALTLNDLIHVYGALHAWSEQAAAADEASRRWRALGNLPMLADSLSTGAMYIALSGQLDVAERWAAEAYEISRRINNSWGEAYSLSQLSQLAWFRAEYETAIRQGEECLRQAHVAGYIVALALNRTELAQMFADLGQWTRAEAEARLALDWAREHIPVFTLMVQAVLAQILVDSGRPEAASALLETVVPQDVPPMFWISEPIQRARTRLALARHEPGALELAQSHLSALRSGGLRLLVPQAQAEVALAHQQAGDLEAANAAYAEALASAEAIGLRRLTWRIQQSLAEVETQRGNPAEAARHAAAAAALVNEIAAALPTESLRQSFLAHAR
jgi:tetratricopeptide (TPR) repeat protein